MISERSKKRWKSLILNASQVLLKIIYDILYSFLKREMPQEQAGIIKGKGNWEQLLNLRIMVERIREHKAAFFLLCY